MGGNYCSNLYNEKDKRFGSNEYLQFGSCSIKGERNYNNDAILAEKNITLELEDRAFKCSSFGIFDGIINPFSDRKNEISSFCELNFLETMLDCERKRMKPLESRRTEGLSLSYNIPFEEDKYIEDGFLKLDSEFAKRNLDDTACNCVAGIIVQRNPSVVELITMSLGVSASLFCRNGKIVWKSTPHRPETPTEEERIRKSGSFVENNLVNGVYGISRCFGQHCLKKVENVSPRSQPVTCIPDIQRFEGCFCSDYTFLLLCSRGFCSDIVDYQKICDFIIDRMKEQESNWDEYYINEENRTKNLYEGYRGCPLSHPTTTKLFQKTFMEEMNNNGCEGGDHPKKPVLYDLDAIAGEVCDFVLFDPDKVNKRKNVSCVIVLFRNNYLRFVDDEKYEKERIKYLAKTTDDCGSRIFPDILKLRFLKGNYFEMYDFVNIPRILFLSLEKDK